mgnify:CR=1 FL=1
MEIRIECDRCHEWLVVTREYSDEQGLRIVVEPCQECLDAAREMAQIEDFMNNPWRED